MKKSRRQRKSKTPMQKSAVNNSFKIARLSIILSTLTLSCLLLAFLSVYRAYDIQAKNGKKYLHEPRNILGSSTDPNELTINYNQQIANGSSMVFGGASSPDINHQDAWDLIASVGVTSIRRDLFIETEIPSNTTLQDYRNNVGNIQDPKNWNWSKGWNNINLVNQIFQNAKKRNMSTIAILTYAPAWLTYSGTNHGVPKDWSVYKDIVKKLYKIHRPLIDMVEVWNEPNNEYFLELKNSPYKTKADAYRDIFRYASEAIREVDTYINDGRRIPLIANTSYIPTDVSVLENLVSSSISSQASFISYHNYGWPEPSSGYYKSVLSKYGKQNIPLFLTEWNYSSSEKKTTPYHTSDLALSYTAQKIIDFLNQGIAGANYFSLINNDPSKIGNMQSVFGFYRLDGNKRAYLLPQGKTWQILSISLGLGKGTSRIYQSNGPQALTRLAFINSANNKGFAVVNNSSLNSDISVPLNMFGSIQGKIINVYAASSYQDGITPCTLSLPKSIGNQSIWVTVPAQAVVGLIVIEPKLTFNSIISDVLGVTTTKTCAILK